MKMSNEDQKITAYITKYALSNGKILKIDARLCGDVSNTMIAYRTEGSMFDQYAHGSDWHHALPEAIAKADEMRVKKIASLKKNIAKLENMRFA
jgi:hypothetical protein